MEPRATTPCWICASCGTSRDKPAGRLPKSWKRLGDDACCPDCWRRRYMLRAITFPVVSPIDGDWKEFREALAEMWAATTQAADWMMTELYARDVRRRDEEKMPPMARVYLYPEARARFPQLPSQSIAALEQSVQAKYRAARLRVIWTCQQSLPTFRYPTPFPVPNQGWRAEWWPVENGEAPTVSVRVGERRFRLRLKGGPRFQRMRHAFEQIISGAAEQGELALYRSGKHTMCKLTAWLPRPETATGLSGTLFVRTDPDSLLVALNAKDERLWALHGDHVVRWSAEHRRQLQRWADDSKAEQRPVPSFAARRAEAADRYHRRMRSAVQEIAAQLTGYARRRRFAGVRYTDGDTSFCEGFPWFALRERIRQKCDEYGIAFEHASGEAEEQPHAEE